MTLSRARSLALVPTLLGAFVGGGALSGCGPGEPAVEPGEIRHVLLISMDTTRADHLGSYGDARGLTPNLDALAQRAVCFEQATSPAPTTLAAHTSMLTGSYPQTHGVARNGFTVHPDNVTLAELFQSAGWGTGAVLGSFALDSRFGLDQGFDRFDERFSMGVAGGRDQNQRSAKEVTDATLAQLGQAGSGLSFHFAHYFDPHVPYEAPAEFHGRFAREGAPLRADDQQIEERVRALQAPILGQGVGLGAVIGSGLRAELLEQGGGEASDADLELASLYAAEVAYMDHHIGRLLEGLEASGQAANTLIVVTGDHGETLWEHGDFWNHGLWLYQTSVHVPLLLAFPDGRGAGTRVSEPVSTIDLLPTMAELFALELPERCEGVSLLGAVDGQALGTRPLFLVATQPYGAEPPADSGASWVNVAKPQGVRKGPWKYVVAPYLGGYQQLFHLGRDPGEQQNLLLSPLGPAATAAHGELEATLKGHWSSATPLPSQFDPSQAAETARILKQLGYGGSSEEEAGDLSEAGER